MFRLPCALFLLVLIPSLSSCTRNSGYRQSEALTVEKRESGAVLGHVEFDDQGELISTRQLNQVTEKIRS